MNDTVVPIRRNELDNFERQSTGSTGWFNINNEWLNVFYIFVLKRVLKVNISKRIKPL